MQLSERIRRRMKLQNLHVLMTVVQTGSMGKAAARLNSCQPAISRSIAELEHALGVRLLDRSPQGAKPTEYGRVLLEGGTAVFDELHRTVKNIEFLADPSAGEVRVGCNPLLAATYVSAAIDYLSQHYPRIVFRLVVGYVETLHRELIERNVDLLIARRFGSIADDRLDCEFLFDDTYSVVVGAENPWSRRRKIELASLADERWVLPPLESAFGSIVMEAFRAIGLDYPHTVVIAEPFETRIALVATGRFVSIFPASLLRFSAMGPDLKILPVKHSMRPVPVGIVTLKNRTLSPVAYRFIESARNVAKPLAKVSGAGRFATALTSSAKA